MFEDSSFNRYQRLTDSIYQQILDSSDELLAESRSIVERIQKRELYKYVGSVTLPTENDKLKHKKSDIEQEFFAFATDCKGINPKDIVMDV